MTAEMDLWPLWRWCVTCGGTMMIEQNVATEEPQRPPSSHMKCGIAARLWRYRDQPFPDTPPDMPPELLPPWVITSAARHRRRAKHRWTRHADVSDLRVVS